MSDYTRENTFYGSDSFESDTECTKKGISRKVVSSQPIQSKNDKLYKAYKPNSLSSKNRQRNSNKKFIQQERFNSSEIELTSQRILSAKKHKIAQQNNIIRELQIQMENLQLENRTLKSQSYLQEKALHKIDGKQSDLPRIFEQHQSELTSLKEQLRRMKDILNNEIKQRKDSDNEIIKLRKALTKANQLVSDKNLGERSTLQTQLLEAQEKQEASEKLLESMNKQLENLEKSHKREVNNLKKQVKLFENQCRDLDKDIVQMKTNLKEKEKLLEIQNIYSHRIKIPHRLPTTSTDPGMGISCSVQNNDHNLDKLPFNNVSDREQNLTKVAQINQFEDNNQKYLDPEKIKNDIRKIIEEEILSGRIKSVEYQNFDQLPLNSNGYEPDRITPFQDSNNDDRTINSEIFDKEPFTQVESIIEDVKPTNEEKEQMENELRQRQIILEKLNAIQEAETVLESSEKVNVQKYSYPKDENYIDYDSINEIETISTVDINKKSNKSYKFSTTIENLHHGRPVQVNNNEVNYRRRSSEIKTIVLTSKKDPLNIPIEASFAQKNNNNSIDQSPEEFLPPLSEVDRQNKERELMSSLFGQVQSKNSNKPCSTTLPWDNENSVRISSPKKLSTILSTDFRRSEDIEEISL